MSRKHFQWFERALPRRPRSTRLLLEVLEARTLLDVGLSVGPNVNVSGPRAGNQSEGTVSINPTDPTNLWAASNDPAGRQLFGRYSNDGGLTWNASDTTTIPNSCCDAQSAFDQFGNLFVVYLSSSAPSVITAMSVDGGQTFRTVDTYSNNNGIDQPSIATGVGDQPGTGSVWISFTQAGIKVRGARVYGANSVDPFSGPLAVPGSSNGSFGNIAVGPNGEVLVTYENPSAGEGPASILVNSNATGLGGSFGPAILATGTNVGGFTHIPAQSSRSVDAEANLAFDNSGDAFTGRLFLVYTDRPSTTSSATNIFERYSDDDGQTWTAPVQVTDDTGTNSKFNPALAVDQTSGLLAVTWYDARDSSTNQSAEVWGTISLDSGDTFLPNVQISTGLINAHASDPGFEFGDYDLMDFNNGCFNRVWADNTLPGHNGLDLATAQVCVVDTGSAPGSSGRGLDHSAMTPSGGAGTKAAARVDETFNLLAAAVALTPSLPRWVVLSAANVALSPNEVVPALRRQMVENRLPANGTPEDAVFARARPESAPLAVLGDWETTLGSLYGKDNPPE